MMIIEWVLACLARLIGVRTYVNNSLRACSFVFLVRCEEAKSIT